MQKLIATAPEVAEVVLNNSLTYSNHAKSDLDYEICYNYDWIDIHPDKQARGHYYFGPLEMVTYKRENLLSHPVTTSLIHEKWARLGRWFYVLGLSVYILFVALLTSVVVLEKRREREDKDIKLVF